MNPPPNDSASPAFPAEIPPAPPAPETPPAPERRPLAQRVVLALLLIGAAALIGYVIAQPDGEEGNPDALSRSVEAAQRIQLVLETSEPMEARSFVRDEFGWRVGVPVFETAVLRGVALAEVAPAVEVPVFLYDGAEPNEVAVFAYSYALLDQVPDRLRLSEEDYADLAASEPVTRHAGSSTLLLWRDRDDIYVAVTEHDPADLAGGLTIAR